MTSEKFETISVKNIDPDPRLNHNWLESSLTLIDKRISVSPPDSDEIMDINTPPEKMEEVISKIRNSGLEILEK